MSDRYERIGGSSVASNHYYEFRAVEFLFVLYTFGIFYILCSGLINFQKPSDDSVTLYGIDGVSGFYGPGSWAAWLLTTLACCIERLFHRRQAINRPQKSTLGFKSGIDLNLVAVYSYPIIAGVDLLRRCRRYDFSSPASSSEIGCIAASLTVLRMGTGLGTLLSGLSIRKRVIHQTSLLPALFTIGASSVLFVMSVTFEFILIGTRFQDFALNLFGLPGRKIQSNPPDAGLGVLLENSALVDEVVRLPLLALYFGGGGFRDRAANDTSYRSFLLFCGWTIDVWTERAAVSPNLGHRLSRLPWHYRPFDDGHVPCSFFLGPFLARHGYTDYDGEYRGFRSAVGSVS